MRDNNEVEKNLAIIFNSNSTGDGIKNNIKLKTKKSRQTSPI